MLSTRFRQVERTVSRFTEVAGTKVQWNDQRTNGITHVNLLYDLSELPWHLVPYLPLFSSLLSELGAGDRDYRQLAQAIKVRDQSQCITQSFQRIWTHRGWGCEDTKEDVNTLLRI
jgi:Zn-dependent M16 (insulinase) family peptidase